MSKIISGTGDEDRDKAIESALTSIRKALNEAVTFQINCDRGMMEKPPSVCDPPKEFREYEPTGVTDITITCWGKAQ